MSQDIPEDEVLSTLLTRGPRAPKPVSFRARKVYCLLGMLAWFFAAGALDPFVSEYAPFSFLLSLLGIMLILLWCHYDAAQRCYRIKLPLSILIFAIALVGVPLYFVITRRWRAVISLALTILFAVLCGLAAGLGTLTTYLLTGRLPAGT